MANFDSHDRYRHERTDSTPTGGRGRNVAIAGGTYAWPAGGTFTTRDAREGIPDENHLADNAAVDSSSNQQRRVTHASILVEIRHNVICAVV